MKEYKKPEVRFYEFGLEDILLVSTSEDMLDFEGDFEEIW